MNTKTVCIALLCAALLYGAPAAAETYTMEAAVQRALQANTNIKAAEKSAEASQSALNVARGSFGPTVNAGFSVTRTEQRRLANSVAKELPFATYDSGLTKKTWAITASQPIFTGFNLLNTAQKAALEAEYQEQQLENVRISIVNGVQSLFLKYLMAEESVKSSERSLARAREQLDTARTAFTLGLRPKLDVLQAELDMASTEAKLIENENSREITRAQLNTLLNLPVDAPVDYSGALTLIPFQQTFEQCVEKAFAQRPDIKMAQKSLQKMEKDLGIARSTFLPQIQADLQWANVDGRGNYKIGPVKVPVHSDVTSLEVGVTAGINLFSSGKRYNTIKQVKSGIQAMEAQVEGTCNNAAYDVKSNLLKLQDSRRTVDVAERSLVSARQSYADAKMRYELQLATNLEMLTALSGLANAELSVISSKAGYLVALSNLYASMGEIHMGLLP